MGRWRFVRARHMRCVEDAVTTADIETCLERTTQIHLVVFRQQNELVNGVQKHGGAALLAVVPSAAASLDWASHAAVPTEAVAHGPRLARADSSMARGLAITI